MSPRTRACGDDQAEPGRAAPSVESGACTNPLVCQAVADVVRELGAAPIIAESSARGCPPNNVDIIPALLMDDEDASARRCLP